MRLSACASPLERAEPAMQLERLLGEGPRARPASPSSSLCAPTRWVIDRDAELVAELTVEPASARAYASTGRAGRSPRE